MGSYAWTKQDLEQMQASGIQPSVVEHQLELFKNPPAFIHLVRPAVLDDGIFGVSDEQIDRVLERFESARQEGRFLKFVPASGAATRMFQVLFKFAERPALQKADVEKEAKAGDADCQKLLHLMENLAKTAFYAELEEVVTAKGQDLNQILARGEYGTVLQFLLGADGLDYAQKPKGLIHFHKYKKDKRTSFEEHLVEAKNYSVGGAGSSRVHFTVSQEHMEKFQDHYGVLKSKSHRGGFDVEFSVQDPSTQTIAVDAQNEPFRDPEGQLVFRPAGHGALIHNLNSLKADLVFIKNIDNVTVESALEKTVLWKKVLGGVLVALQAKMFGYLGELEKGDASQDKLQEVAEFCQLDLSMDLGTNFESLNETEKSAKLKELLDRPIRVCGVVPNTGEPGGGPFWVKNHAGVVSLQIVESSQINLTDPEQKNIFESSTHFNPVDLVCGLKDHHGKAFDLLKFIDPDTVFISRKSVGGKEIKALELPGLWNGAMAGWVTVFIEVPVETFNPVKTVFDLLKPAHQV